MNTSPSEHDNPGIERARFQLRASGVRGNSYTPLRSGIHNRGYLPHVKREGACYFVTFRLGDSLPREVLLKLEAEKAARIRAIAANSAESESEILLEFQRNIERFLDRGAGACHLQKPDIAEIVSGALKHFHSERYLLHEWVVMPNHVHVLVWPMPNELLSAIVKSWKQFTSRRAKALLGIREETFWQRESYDHWIRNDEEKVRVAQYIRNNPVKAGLCARPEDWRWSSAWRPTP